MYNLKISLAIYFEGTKMFISMRLQRYWLLNLQAHSAPTTDVLALANIFSVTTGSS